MREKHEEKKTEHNDDVKMISHSRSFFLNTCFLFH